MKKLLLIIVSFILIFTGCNKTEKDTAKEPIVQIRTSVYDSIGYWHNVAVKSAVKNFNAKNEVNYKDIRELMIQTLNSIDSVNFILTDLHSNATLSDAVLKDVLNMVENDTVLNISNGSFIPIFSHLLSQGEISTMLYQNLLRLDSLANNGTNVVIFINEVHALQLQNWTASDQLYVDTLIQVIDASFEFWSNQGALNSKACDVCIIWADAAGAAYGLLCGPLCSIIEGAVFSTVAYLNSER